MVCRELLFLPYQEVVEKGLEFLFMRMHLHTCICACVHVNVLGGHICAVVNMHMYVHRCRDHSLLREPLRQCLSLPGISPSCLN